MQLDEPNPVRPVDLDATLLRILRRWEPTAPHAWSATSTIGVAEVNPERLEAALDCLIDNAVKFTRAGDGIALVGRRDGHGWTIEVVDSGTGIPPDAVPKLLTGRAGENTPTGTGLGLVIVRTVAESLGGRLIIGEVPGGGARIGLWAPLAVSSSPQSPSAVGSAGSRDGTSDLGRPVPASPGDRPR